MADINLLRDWPLLDNGLALCLYLGQRKLRKQFMVMSRQTQQRNPNLSGQNTPDKLLFAKSVSGERLLNRDYVTPSSLASPQRCIH
jgi:hypothetical protein